MERKTLTEWPMELPDGRWEYIVDVGITVSGSFVESVNGGLLFESDVTGSQWEASGFTDGETFVPLGADPDPRDARIAALEGEVADLKGRLRETYQILVESVGGLGPCDAEDAARRAAELVDQLRAQLAAPTEGDDPTYAEGGLYDKNEDSLLTSLGFPGTLDEAVAETKRLRHIAKEVEKVLGEDASPRDVRRALGESSRQPCGVGVTTHPEDSIGVRMIAAERQRQMTHEGWTPEHDDEHKAGELASAAACYAGQVFTPTKDPPPGWPWERRWWKPKGGRIRVLVKAGALIAAEIDRLARAGEKS